MPPKGTHEFIKEGRDIKCRPRVSEDISAEKVVVSAERPRLASLALQAGKADYYALGSVAAVGNPNQFPVGKAFYTGHILDNPGVTGIQTACKEEVCTDGTSRQNRPGFFETPWLAGRCSPTKQMQGDCPKPSLRPVFENMKWCEKRKHVGASCTKI